MPPEVRKVLRFVGYAVAVFCLAIVMGCAAIGALFIAAMLFGSGQ